MNLIETVTPQKVLALTKQLTPANRRWLMAQLQYLDTPQEIKPSAEPMGRATQAQQVAQQAATLLRDNFQATRVVLFGSLATKTQFTPWSDIDLAVWDIPDEKFYQAVAAVTKLSSDFKIDLVDVNDCQPVIREAIEQEGIELWPQTR